MQCFIPERLNTICCSLKLIARCYFNSGQRNKLVNNRKIRFFSGEKVNFVCPSIDVAMNSVISRPDDRIVGVILTGMGKDGVQGLAYIKHLGGDYPCSG